MAPAKRVARRRQAEGNVTLGKKLMSTSADGSKLEPNAHMATSMLQTQHEGTWPPSSSKLPVSMESAQSLQAAPSRYWHA